MMSIAYVNDYMTERTNFHSIAINFSAQFSFLALRRDDSFLMQFVLAFDNNRMVVAMAVMRRYFLVQSARAVGSKTAMNFSMQFVLAFDSNDIFLIFFFYVISLCMLSRYNDDRFCVHFVVTFGNNDGVRFDIEKAILHVTVWS